MVLGFGWSLQFFPARFDSAFFSSDAPEGQRLLFGVRSHVVGQGAPFPIAVPDEVFPFVLAGWTPGAAGTFDDQAQAISTVANVPVILKVFV